MRKSIAAVALIAAASMTAVGLAPAASAAEPAADGVTVAKAIVAKYSSTPTSIGNIPPITQPIPKNKYVIAVSGNTDAGQVLLRYQVEAGRLLGWKTESIVTPQTLEGQRIGLQQAISKKPDAITVSGMETDSYGDLYKKAAAQGTAIICSACMSKPGSGLVDSHVAGPKMLDLWGQMIAAFAVANVQGTPNVQMFGISIYPILRRYDRSFELNLKRLSPKATTKFNELDFANGIPQQVGNVYRANPGTNFISSDLGDFFIGVPQGLFQVGATPGQKPLIGGLTAGKDSIQTLKNKTTNAWTAYSLPIVGYSVIDSVLRYFLKVPFSTADLPTQILTQKNIGTAVLTKQGDYLGVKDFQAQFKKVWGIN